MNIYSQFLLNDDSHITYEFKPGRCSLPEDCNDGDIVEVKKIGFYHDDDIDADIVKVILLNGEELTHQKGGTILHITRECRNGVSPVQSGIRAMKNGWIKTEPSMPMKAKACYFEGK